MRPLLVVAAALLSVACASPRASAPPAGAEPLHKRQGAQATEGQHGEHRAHHPRGGDANHRFADADAWAARFENPERDEWQKPEEVVRALAVPEGGKVADIGAATGYFPVRIARAHPDATVYGVDVEPDMTRYLAERAKKEGLSNLHAVLGEPADPKLPEAVDRVLVVNTYHHIEERTAYFERLASSLKPGARVMIVDFKMDAPIGPGKEHKLPRQTVLKEMEAAGYRVAEERDLPWQYVLIFERA